MAKQTKNSPGKSATEKVLIDRGWVRVSLTGRALGYRKDFDDTYFTVWLPPNIRHIILEDDGAWSLHEGAGELM